MQPLDLHLTESARAHIARLTWGQEAGTLPAIFFASGQKVNAAGVAIHQDPPYWHLNVYTRAQIDQFAEGYAALGHSLVYDAHGVLLCVPQPQLAAELSGKTLDVEGRNVWVR